VDEFTGSVSYGAYNTNADGTFPDGTPNTDGNRLDTDRDGNVLGDDQSLDGGSVKISGNYGVAIGEEGYANFTTEYINKNKTLRPGYDFRRGFGEAAIEGFNIFGNVSFPVSEKTEVYAFGGRNYRDTDAYAFTRNDGERVVESIYPNGFNPRITTLITDNSYAVGVRSELGNDWKVDLSNSYGENEFHYYIQGTLNASLEGNSPTDFDAGGTSLSQNTINLDFSKYYDDILEGFNLALGAEYRTENFIIFAGEEGSYATYDVDGRPITDPENQQQPTAPNGELRPGGSQGFPGYSPANAVDRSRSNLSLYADAEIDLTDKFLVATAARFENYSDFGSTINGKIAARYKLTDDVNIRGSVSSGFRAPSLAQIYYNLRFTDFQGGVATESLLSANNSPVTASFGIGALKEETATNGSLGFTATFGEFTATIDGYYVSVNDRIVLTGTFPAPQIDNVNEAQFFVNGVDTETTGVDIILSYRKLFSDGSFSASFLGNINDIKIKNVNNGGLDEDTFFGARERAFLLAAAPESKFGLNLSYSKQKFTSALSFTRYGEVVLVDFGDEEDVYSPKITVDTNIGYEFTDNIKLSIGSNNLFNAYPDQQNDENTESGGYWDSVQMGFAGAYYYSRLDFKF